MALSLSDGRYLAIEDITRSNITFRIHKDVDQRARYKAGTTDSFETTFQETASVLLEIDCLPDPAMTIRGNLLTKWYEALKTLERFSEAIDV